MSLWLLSMLLHFVALFVLGFPRPEHGPVSRLYCTILDIVNDTIIPPGVQDAPPDIVRGFMVVFTAYGLVSMGTTILFATILYTGLHIVRSQTSKT